jgi:ribosomal protein L4
MSGIPPPQIPSPEEFEQGQGSKRSVLRPIVRFARRLRLRPDVGTNKQMREPELSKNTSGERQKGTGEARQSSPREIVFRAGVRYVGWTTIAQPIEGVRGDSGVAGCGTLCDEGTTCGFCHPSGR